MKENFSKALYVDDEYYKILKEEGYSKAKEYRKEKQQERRGGGGDGKPEFVYGGAAGAHRIRKERVLNEIRDERLDNIEKEVFPNDTLGQDMDNRFNKFILDKFDLLIRDERSKKILRVKLRKTMFNYINTLQSGLSKKDSSTQIFNTEEKLIKSLGGMYPDDDSVTEIARALRLAAYSHNGWVNGGGEKFEYERQGDSNSKAGYSETISGVDNMKEAAMLEYYKKITNNKDAKIPEGAEFDKLTKKWGGFKKAALYATLASLPTIGMIGAGSLTGDSSLLIHILASAGGLAGGTVASYVTNKIGSRSGSHLYDIKKLAGLKELGKRLNSEGYLPRPSYGIVKSAMRSLFGHRPPNKVRVQEISRGDLYYILKRGETTEENWQKRSRLVAAILPIVALGFAHNASPSPIITPEAIPIDTPPATVDIITPLQDFWKGFFTFDGTTMPGFDAPKIPDCYAPKTLCTN